MYIETDKRVDAITTRGIIIYFISGTDLFVFNSDEEKVVNQKRVLEKESKTVGISVTGEYVFVSNFITLLILNKDTLSEVEIQQIGEDLKSDILRIMVQDEDYLYFAIRNGGYVKLNKETFSYKIHHLSKYSSWDIELLDGLIYAGNTNGEILVIDTEEMKVIKRERISNKNINSLRVNKDRILCSSGDKKLRILDRSTLQVIDVIKPRFKKEFIVDVFYGKIYVTGFREELLRVFDLNSKLLINEIEIEEALLGELFLYRNKLLMISRSIMGVKEIENIGNRIKEVT